MCSAASDPFAIDGDRLIERLRTLAAVGADPGGGTTRPAFSESDQAARALVLGWMEAAGLEVTLDAATNVIGRVGPTPRIAIGSHLDSVPNGGGLDGAYGVVAAIEVVDALRSAAGPTVPGLAVVAFANEEGSSGFTPFTGSRAIVGAAIDLDERDADGRSLREALQAVGGRPRDLAHAAWTPEEVSAFVELHIEQGPVLEVTGDSIGVVTGITGRRVVRVTVVGDSNHAGTTPMTLRHDALAGAAELVLAVEALGRDDRVTVATTGALEVFPGAANVVAGRAELVVDLRDLDDGRLDRAVDELKRGAADVAGARGLRVTTEVTASFGGVGCDPGLVAVLTEAAGRAGMSTRSMPSGAGHDAQVMSVLAPAAMLFVPSRAGVSHSPLEHTHPHHLIDGANVLLAAIHALGATL